MKESTIRIIVLIAIILAEGLLVVINIPELSLVASIVLLIALLLASGAGSWIAGKIRAGGHLRQGLAPPAVTGDSLQRDGKERTLPREEHHGHNLETMPTTTGQGFFRRIFSRSKDTGAGKAGSDGGGAPAGEQTGHSGVPAAASPTQGVFGRIFPGKKDTVAGEAGPAGGGTPVWKGTARQRVSPAPSGAGASRFETFSMMSRGWRLFVASCLSRGKTRESDLEGAGGDGHPPGSPENQLTLASMEPDTVSPVAVRRDPNPFSPLIKNPVLDSDLASSVDQGRNGGGRDIAFDAIPGEQVTGEAIPVLDEDARLTLDEEDMAPPSPDAPYRAGPELREDNPEVTIEEELDELEKLELDVMGLETGEEARAGTASEAQDRPKEAALEKTMRDLDVREEYMSTFAKESPTGEVDLLSSMKSESKGKRKVNQSLVRDLKDVPVQVRDIEEDLVALLSSQKKRW